MYWYFALFSRFIVYANFKNCIRSWFVLIIISSDTTYFSAHNIAVLSSYNLLAFSVEYYLVLICSLYNVDGADGT